MKKRFLSIMMALCLTLSLLPATALAADNEVGTAEALATALETGGNIKLIDDITVNTEQDWTITEEVVLDLNGHSITSTYNQSNYFLFTVNGGSLTLNDSSKEGTGKIEIKDASSSYPLQLTGTGSRFTMNGGTISAIEDALDIYTFAKDTIVNINGGVMKSQSYSTLAIRGSNTVVNITDGLIENDGSYGAFVSSGSGSTDPESIIFNMTGGKLTSTGTGILTDYALTVNINDKAEIETKGTGISVKGTTILNIAGGSITAGSYALQGSYNSSINVSGGEVKTTRSNLATVSLRDESTVEISGGTIVGTKVLNGDEENIALTGGTFQTSSGTPVDVTAYLPSGMTQVNGQVVVDTQKAVATVNGVGYDDFAKALDAAETDDTVTLLKDVTITDTITIDKDITITAVEGATVTAKTDGFSFVLSNGATLDGLTVELGDLEDNGAVNVVLMNDRTTVKNCKFTGQYVLDRVNEQGESNPDGEVSRAIEGSSGKLTITGNTFEDLRQPAYINACTGEISNNHVSGTRGWVICGNSNMEITGNTFGTNAVDIAIIDDNTGDSTNTNHYAEKITKLSKSNGGAYTQNQLSMAEAEDGALVVGKSDGYTLDKALAAAQEGDTVRLLDNVESATPITIPAGVTLDGGDHAINYTGEKKTDNPSVLVLAGQGADGVTVQNVTLNTNGNLKHGVEFFAADSGKLSNVTVNGGSYTAVQNNGSTGLVIENCVLNPDVGAYTNIEYALSDSAQTAGGTTPSMTIDNVTFDSSTLQVWADQDTTANVKEEMAEDGTSDATNEQILNEINGNITTKNSDSINVSVRFEEDGAVETITKPSTKPVEPDDDDDRPSSSGGSSSSEPSYSPVMDVAKGGSVKVNPRTPGEGDEVTITVDPDRGYEVGDVTVTDRSGRDVRVTAERDGTYTFEQPKGRVTIAVTFVREGSSTFFTDVAETYWAYDEIAWAYENGYVNGVTATTFAPGASISRQQIWMILARIAGDDPADMAAARQWSIDNGISDGTNPGSAVTRQQLAALLYRFAELMGLDTTAGGMAIREFPDYEAVASYAAEAMDWAVSAGIINGTTDGTLNPTGTATRAQFAVMLYRFWTGV